MEAFLLNWGTELLFALLAAGVTGFFKWKSSKLKKKLDDYETMVNEQTAQKNEEMMESKLEPIYQELEDLRAYIRETQNIEKAHMALIIASYRFRLVQLCKGFLAQGYITPAQMETLATTLVGVLAVFNGLGRILTGAMFDALGRKKTMLIAIPTVRARPVVFLILRISLLP